ncbi:hypothetical protein Nepgr_026024 [Nepenthes gracilis]|uniref:Uncharacterized protein n=1 Tax=Nepenthes gracilis TaxID=150966 RepID=A0AAD3Y231_NEPGR|nr:hypothetical protein Nepgr_026024 [Nepenthes gracilis]
MSLHKFFSLFCRVSYNLDRVQEAIRGPSTLVLPSPLWCYSWVVESLVSETILQKRGSEEAHMALEVQCLYSLLDVTWRVTQVSLTCQVLPMLVWMKELEINVQVME